MQCKLGPLGFREGRALVQQGMIDQIETRKRSLENPFGCDFESHANEQLILSVKTIPQPGMWSAEVEATADYVGDTLATKSLPNFCP